MLRFMACNFSLILFQPLKNSFESPFSRAFSGLQPRRENSPYHLPLIFAKDFGSLRRVISGLLRTSKKLLQVSGPWHKSRALRSRSRGALCSGVCPHGTLPFPPTCSISPIAAVLLVSQHLCLISRFWRPGIKTSLATLHEITINFTLNLSPRHSLCRDRSLLIVFADAFSASLSFKT